jgi:hypothetical protein
VRKDWNIIKRGVRWQIVLPLWDAWWTEASNLKETVNTIVRMCFTVVWQCSCKHILSELLKPSGSCTVRCSNTLFIALAWRIWTVTHLCHSEIL